ncbi:GNAT family N-acetyltransferase [Candidatus Poribacteria bacterium]|nr:GNAT family N-acetyltransferase [Candidatus Poribacteria bacterium]
MEDITIRNWKEGDDENIYKLFDRTCRWLSNEAYANKFNDKGLKPEGIILAEKDGLIIGHVMGNWTDIMYEGKPTKFAGIGQVMVDENFRGYGIGKAMLKKIIDYHISGNCRGIILWTQKTLVPAYPMYQKLDFQPVVNRAFYRFRPKTTTSSLSVEPYRPSMGKEAEKVRIEWMHSCFPVGVNNMKPGSGNCWVLCKNKKVIGYFCKWENDGVATINSAVSFIENASEMCSAVIGFLKAYGYKEVVWQTCAGSIWQKKLNNLVQYEEELLADVRMCKSIGSPINIERLLPEFDGCSTW